VLDIRSFVPGPVRWIPRAALWVCLAIAPAVAGAQGLSPGEDRSCEDLSGRSFDSDDGTGSTYQSTDFTAASLGLLGHAAPLVLTAPLLGSLRLGGRLGLLLLGRALGALAVALVLLGG